MAKKKQQSGLTADEKQEQATLEANVVAEEAVLVEERTQTGDSNPDVAPTTDARVAEVFSAPEPVETPGEPVVAPEPSAAEAWHAEAEEILALTRAGNPVSPARVVAALSQAVGLVPR